MLRASRVFVSVSNVETATLSPFLKSLMSALGLRAVVLVAASNVQALVNSLM